MPRKTKKYVKRRRNNRYRKRRNRVPRQLIPNKATKTFRYQTSVTLDPSAVSIDSAIFRMNGMYDPEVAVGGHQPLGFDQYIGILYDHFVVIGCKITATFASNSSTTTGAYIVGITPTDSTTALPTTVSTIIEQGRSVHKQVQPYVGGNSIAVLRKKMNPNKFLGRSHPLSDPELKGNVVSDPSEQAHYHVWAASTNGSTDPSTIECNVLLEYLAVMIEPKILAAS